MNHDHIPGYAADRDPSQRPGIPLERTPELWSRSGLETQQPSEPSVFHPSETQRRRLPPVFGTAQPPRGLSGILRDYAYRTPAHQRRHWLTLLLADRVDVIEHNPG